MKRTSLLFLVCLLNMFWLTCWQPNIHAADERVHPTLNKGKKWRIGYYEGGPWQDYRESLKAVVEGLMDAGWIEKQPLPKVSISDQHATFPLWNWLSSSLKSQYIEFVADAFWTSDWNEDARKHARKVCIQRLKEGDVDLMFAMGTWAGKDIANNSHAIPTMVMSTSDPIQSGIIQSAEDSGFDHVHARCDPTRRQRQIRLFHDIIKFKRVGVVYDNTDPNGRVMAHLNELEQIGRENGFDVIICAAPDSQKSLQAAIDGYRACVRKLAPEVDAFYLSDVRGTEPELLFETIQPLFKHKVPTWSARGSILVKYGALLSVARKNYDFLAPFYAEVVARIFNGTKPRQIPQVVKEKMRMSINLETAKIIGFNVPPNLLKVADLVYDRIEVPQEDL